MPQSDVGPYHAAHAAPGAAECRCQLKASRRSHSYEQNKKRVGPAIAAVEVSRSTRSHPIENVRPLFYIKSIMLNDERKELLSHFSRVVARPIPPSAGLQVDWE